MANEITLTGSLAFTKGKSKASISGSGNADVVGDHYTQNVQNIGTAEESLVKGDIGTIGYCAFRNLDATNFVELGATTGVYSLKINPGKFVGPLFWNGTAIHAKADTAPIELDYLLIEL